MRFDGVYADWGVMAGAAGVETVNVRCLWSSSSSSCEKGFCGGRSEPPRFPSGGRRGSGRTSVS